MQENKHLTGYPSIDKPWLKYYTEEAIYAPLPECTVYEYLWEKNKDHLNDIALSYFDRKITFGEMFTSIEKTAKAFSAMGLKKGDIIIMATVTTPETVYAFYALNRLGVIPNMVDPRTSAEGIRDYILEVDSKVILTTDVVYPKIEKAAAGINVKSIIVVSLVDSLPSAKKTIYCAANQLKGTTPKLGNDSILWEQFIERGNRVSLTTVPYEKNMCCIMVHTGGTTGMPKGVMLSNDNLNAATHQALNSPLLMKRGDVFLNIMPPFIAYGMVLGIHTAFSAGWKSVIIPKFDPTEFDTLLLKYRPNGIMGVPSYFEFLMNSPKLFGVDLSFIQVMLVGGDRTATDFEDKVNSFFAAHKCRIHLSKGYSMTEASSSATVSYENANCIGSSGIPMSRTIVSAFDPDTNKEVAYRQKGEICISSPTAMLGYYGMQEETTQILKKHSDGNIWVHSGDLGYVDENGFIFIEGRLKRMIIRHDGFKIFPTLIEKIVNGNPAVASCCAVGVTDKAHSQGKLPVVFVVLNPSFVGKENIIERELVDLCRKELPEYAQPVAIIFYEKLPLTPIGKVDYCALERNAQKEIPLSPN